MATVDIADKTTLDAVNSKIGNSTDAVQTPTLMGKLTNITSQQATANSDITIIKDRIGSDSGTLFDGMNELLSRTSVVRKIQRGTATMNSTAGTTINFPTALTNPDKCLVLLNGSEIRSGDTYSSLPYLDNLSTTSMSVKGGNGQHGYTCSWQVIEFY